MVCLLWTFILKFTRAYIAVYTAAFVPVIFFFSVCVLSFLSFLFVASCFYTQSLPCKMCTGCLFFAYHLIWGSCSSLIALFWGTAIQILKKLLMLNRSWVIQIFIKRLGWGHGVVVLSVCHSIMYSACYFCNPISCTGFEKSIWHFRL